MRRFVLSSLLSSLVCLIAARSMAQATNSPVGTWAVNWSGRDNALTYLTFTVTSNSMDWGGYGISAKSFGPLTINGTWDYDSKARVVGGYTESFPTDAESGHIVVKLPGSNKFRGTAFGTNGRFGLNGEPAGAVPNITGSNWVWKVRTRGNTFFEDDVITASTNMLGWFDLIGQGSGPDGTFTVSGALIVNSDRHVNGFTIRDFGASGSITSSFSGRFNVPLNKVILTGKDDDHRGVVIHATK